MELVSYAGLTHDGLINARGGAGQTGGPTVVCDVAMRGGDGVIALIEPGSLVPQVAVRGPHHQRAAVQFHAARSSELQADGCRVHARRHDEVVLHIAALQPE